MKNTVKNFEDLKKTESMDILADINELNKTRMSLTIHYSLTTIHCS